MFTLGSNFNCYTAACKNLCIVPPPSLLSASRGSIDVFQGLNNNVLTLQICLYWAAVLIPTLVTLKHLMPVSSMWPIGPLVLKSNLQAEITEINWSISKGTTALAGKSLKITWIID